MVLLGLAAKNAILIVEFAKQWQDHEGVDAKEAAVHSARVRLRPILMTSLAFIAGVAPLAVAHGAGSEMRQSLGTTVFFGMLGVTVFGLLFTPAFYALVRKAKVKKDRTTRASSLTATAAALSILLLSLFLQGCSVGPKYHAPNSPVAALAPFHNKLDVSNSSDKPAPSLNEWWNGFHDPMLVAIVQRALRQNLDLAASLERVNQARAVATGAGARLYPSGELEASATAEHQSLVGIWERSRVRPQVLGETSMNTQLGRLQAGSSTWRGAFDTMQQPLEMKCKLLKRITLVPASSSLLMLQMRICRSVAIKPESESRKARSKQTNIS